MNEFLMFSGCLAILVWPFVALWTLLTTIIRLIGRIGLWIVGMLIMIAGALLTLTIVGVVVGIPLLILGFLLVARALF